MWEPARFRFDKPNNGLLQLGLGPGRVESTQQIQGRARPDLCVSRQLQVPRPGRQMAVGHEPLTRVEIHAGFDRERRDGRSAASIL